MCTDLLTYLSIYHQFTSAYPIQGLSGSRAYPTCHGVRVGEHSGKIAIYARIYTYGQFGIANYLNTYVFGLWEKPGVPTSEHYTWLFTPNNFCETFLHSAS